MTIEELGIQTKKKYPQYANLSNRELGEKVLQKYPEYQSKIDDRTGFQKATDIAGLKSTIGNIGVLGFLGQGGRTEQAGQASSQAFQQSQQLIQQAKKETNPQKKKQLLDQARAIMQGSAQEMDTFQQDLSKRQDVARISEKEIERGDGQFAWRRALGQSAELASWLLPSATTGSRVFAKGSGVVGQALFPKLATAGGRIGQAATKGAITGGLLGAAESTREADTLAEAGIRTGLGGVAGGVTGAAMQGVFEGGRWMIDKLKGPAKEAAVNMYKKTLKQNVKNKKFYQQYGGEDKVVKDSIKHKISNTKAGAERQLEQFKPEYERIIGEEANKMKRFGKTVDIAQAYENARQKVKDQLGYDDALLKQAEKWFEANARKYANQTNALPTSSNTLRKKLDQKVGQILTPDAVGQDAARKAFVTELRKQFKELATGKAKDSIEKYHLLSGLSDAMMKEPRIGITEAAFAALTPNKLIGLLGGVVARSPGVRRSVAQSALTQGGGQAVQQGVNLPVNLGVNPLSALLQNYIGRSE